MDSWVEGFKLVGSTAGIISGALLLYDRFVRDRLQAYLAKADYHLVDVVLKNAANETLIVKALRPPLSRGASGLQGDFWAIEVGWNREAPLSRSTDISRPFENGSVEPVPWSVPSSKPM
jgi:hypothetical protein